MTSRPFIVDVLIAKLQITGITLLPQSNMNSGICPAFDTSSPQACDCNDGRRSYLSISERQSVESILVAALKGGILNSSFNSNGGHGVNTNCFVRPNVYSSFLPSHAGQYDLAMLALARPIDLLVALHLAIPTAGTFWPMTPNVQNSLPINIYPQGMARHVLPTDRRKPSFGQALSLLLGKDKASWPVDLIHRLQDIRCQHLNLSLTDTGNNDFSASRAVVDLVKHKNNEDTLITLGSKCLERRRDKVPYFDASTLMDPDSAKLANRRRGGGVLEPFPEKLYRMIMEACSEGKEGVISFFPHGRAFGM